MWTVWAALLLTLAASLTDIRERRIPNKLTYPFIALGILNIVLRPDLIFFAALGILFSYALYRLGVWAGGDAKLFFALSLLLPDTFHGIPLYIWAFLLAVLLGGFSAVLYALYRVATDRSVRETVLRPLPSILLRALSVGVALGYLGISGIVVSFLPAPMHAFVALALFLSSPELDALLVGVYASIAALLLYFISIRALVFSKEVSLEELTPGDVPAEIVTEEGGRLPLTLGNVLRVLSGSLRPVVSPFRAAGLEKEDIERLRQMGVKRIRVRRTVPFVPFVLFALIVLTLSMHLGLWI